CPKRVIVELRNLRKQGATSNDDFQMVFVILLLANMGKEESDDDADVENGYDETTTYSKLLGNSTGGNT
ncbi:hypothetical protein Tco_0082633, partial [Tanacetum coccineum]